MSRSQFAIPLWVVLAAMVAGDAGCSKSDPSRYIPTTAVAQDALRAALEAWRNGEPPGAVTSYRVPIQVADSLRRPGQKLKSFDILGEVSEDGGRRFQVRLSLEQPEAEEKVQFIVVGLDPLWVFRREDYDMVIHWEHSSSPAPSGPTSNPPAAGSAGS